jgi:hypothetical protein
MEKGVRGLLPGIRLRLMSNERPSLTEIAVTQNESTSLRYQLAKAHFYKWAKILYFAGAAVTLALALVAPLVLLFRPSLGPMLGAVAGAWIFVSRRLLEPFRQDYQLKGATAQEYFDCRVLGTPWNEALVRPLPDEEISAASRAGRRSTKHVEQAKDWYAASDLKLEWPRSVLMCQRSNAVWACRQHRTYGRFLAGAAITWLIVGIIVAVGDGASLGAYLVTILLPSMPAFLDASELSRAHSSAARDRELIREQMDALLEDGTAETQELREIQDQLFRLRREAPQVPDWFYQLIRPGYEEDMKYAVDELIKRLDGGTS